MILTKQRVASMTINHKFVWSFLFFFILCAAVAEAASSASGGESVTLNLVTHPAGIAAVIVFVLSYSLVLVEEFTHMRKSKPVIFGAGLIWIIVGLVAPHHGVDHATLRAGIFHGLEEYAALLLFLLAAMTYIGALQERRVFAALRARLVQANMNTRQIFWATGFLAFFLSPIADNLTTSLVMGAVIVAVGGKDIKFVSLGCTNIVCAANAGGAFSPFGDITTLMVWQAGKLEFFEFFGLFLPSIACFLVPAIFMSLFVPKSLPWAVKEDVFMKRGAKLIMGLGVLTIAMAVSFEQFLGLPPFFGMMMGLSILMLAAYFLKLTSVDEEDELDIFNTIADAEWDTLLFFFGVIFAVNGLAFLGYLSTLSTAMYDGWGPTLTNVSLGFVSAVVDNIPVMFAVLQMDPLLDHYQWLLITLTTGVGGSLLSIGSAAGVALMGLARGKYTFFSHLKWAPFILLGYGAAIGTHYLVNSHLIGVSL